MKIMDIIDNKYTKNDTWIKDGVLMCNKDCCGAPVSECSCDSSCKKCNCYNLKEQGIEERYGMRGAPVAQGRDQADDMMNMNKRANNKMQDQNREMNIRNSSKNRRNVRLSKKIATGLPQRILNPQQPQAPEGQG